MIQVFPWNLSPDTVEITNLASVEFISFQQIYERFNLSSASVLVVEITVLYISYENKE